MGRPNRRSIAQAVACTPGRWYGTTWLHEESRQCCGMETQGWERRGRVGKCERRWEYCGVGKEGQDMNDIVDELFHVQDHAITWE